MLFMHEAVEEFETDSCCLKGEFTQHVQIYCTCMLGQRSILHRRRITEVMHNENPIRVQ